MYGYAEKKKDYGKQSAVKENKGKETYAIKKWKIKNYPGAAFAAEKQSIQGACYGTGVVQRLAIQAQEDKDGSTAVSDLTDKAKDLEGVGGNKILYKEIGGLAKINDNEAIAFAGHAGPKRIGDLDAKEVAGCVKSIIPSGWGSTSKENKIYLAGCMTGRAYRENEADDLDQNQMSLADRVKSELGGDEFGTVRVIGTMEKIYLNGENGISYEKFEREDENSNSSPECVKIYNVLKDIVRFTNILSRNIKNIHGSTTKEDEKEKYIKKLHEYLLNNKGMLLGGLYYLAENYNNNKIPNSLRDALEKDFEEDTTNINMVIQIFFDINAKIEEVITWKVDTSYCNHVPFRSRKAEYDKDKINDVTKYLVDCLGTLQKSLNKCYFCKLLGNLTCVPLDMNDTAKVYDTSRFHGNVNRDTGEGIMAVPGIPEYSNNIGEHYKEELIEIRCKDREEELRKEIECYEKTVKENNDKIMISQNQGFFLVGGLDLLKILHKDKYVSFTERFHKICRIRFVMEQKRLEISNQFAQVQKRANEPMAGSDGPDGIFNKRMAYLFELKNLLGKIRQLEAEALAFNQIVDELYKDRDAQAGYYMLGQLTGEGK